MDSATSIQQVFESAVNVVRNMPKEGPFKPSDELKLKFYAYFKQATHGENDTPKPRFYDVVNIYKWNAWKKLGSMPMDEAKLAYINELREIVLSMTLDEQDSMNFIETLGPFYEYCKESSLSSPSLLSNYDDDYSNTGHIKENLTNGGHHRPQNSLNSDHHHNISGTGNLHNSSSGSNSTGMLPSSGNRGGNGGRNNNNNIYSTVAQEISDQLALAVLRLQYSMEHTMQRLDSIEARIASAERRQSAVSKRSNNSAINGWFYLTWPVVVYLIFRFIEKKQQNREKRI